MWIRRAGIYEKLRERKHPGKRKGNSEGLHSLLTEAQNAINELKVKWSVASPCFIASFLGGRMQSLRGSWKRATRKPHATQEGTKALEGKETY